eukprot:scaffold43511_cov57-Phaeocystis_antarctica.AAC.2
MAVWRPEMRSSFAVAGSGGQAGGGGGGWGDGGGWGGGGAGGGSDGGGGGGGKIFSAVAARRHGGALETAVPRLDAVVRIRPKTDFEALAAVAVSIAPGLTLVHGAARVRMPPRIGCDVIPRHAGYPLVHVWASFLQPPRRGCLGCVDRHRACLGRRRQLGDRRAELTDLGLLRGELGHICIQLGVLSVYPPGACLHLLLQRLNVL